MTVKRYVVTFDRRPVRGPGALDGLRRMSLDEARYTVRLAGRIPKHGRIIDTVSLDEIGHDEPGFFPPKKGRR